MKNKNNESDMVIRILKLRQGETLISYIRHERDCVLLKDPMTMVYIPLFDKNGNITSTEIAFRDWIEGSVSNEYRIPKDVILVEVEVEKTILKTYNKILTEDEGKEIFDNEYLKDAFDMIQDDDKNNHKNNGPKQEYFEDGEDEDDLDSDGWNDFPPRFKK